MSELEKLRKENQTLRALLATANQLLAKSKDVLAKKVISTSRRKTVKSKPKRRRIPG
jgi:cell shape-determining protein MreC